MASKSLAPVIEAAIEAFAAVGYYGVSMKQIAAKAGVTELTVIRLFKGKSNLFRASLMMAVNRTLAPEQFEALLVKAGDMAPADFDKVVFGALRRWYAALSAETARLIVHAGLLDNREWREIAYGRINQVIKILAAAIEEEAARKKAGKVDATAAARSIVFTLLHSKVARPIVEKRGPEDKFVQTTVQQWVHGIFDN